MGVPMPAGRSAAERRAQKAERDARFRAAALEAMDVGKGWTGAGRSGDAFDAGIELGVKRATEAVVAGRPLSLTERRTVRRDVLARQAEAQPQAKRPSIRERLERMTSEERLAAVASIRDPEAAAYAERIRIDVEEIDADAEYLVALEREESWLGEHEDEEDIEPADELADWSPGMSPAEARVAEHEAAVADPWGSAQASLAAEESEYSDDLEDGFVEDDYLGDEAA
jgi:hypothetical protein